MEVFFSRLCTAEFYVFHLDLIAARLGKSCRHCMRGADDGVCARVQALATGAGWGAMPW